MPEEPLSEQPPIRTSRRVVPGVARGSAAGRARSSAWSIPGIVKVLGVCCFAVVASVGCSDGAERGDATQITVSAAASLTDAFDRMIEDFEAAHHDVTVRANYGSSGQLAEQVANGANVDVVAFADRPTMDRLVDDDLVGPVQTFATNSMVIVTKPDNPADVESPADLASPRAGVVSLCRIDAPCGGYAHEILGAAGVELDRSRITWGQDVRATLGAVTNGDATAAIVYRTDAIAAGERVALIEIPPESNVRADYPIAVVRSRSGSTRSGSGGATPRYEAAEAFVDHVLGDRGRSILNQFGFGAP